MLELHLRRLGAYIYEQRTRDRQGAAHMLGVTPPGAMTDIAPNWTVSDAATHSRQESFVPLNKCALSHTMTAKAAVVATEARVTIRRAASLRDVAAAEAREIRAASLREVAVA